MSAVEFSPQSAGVINVEQSEAARARDTDIGVATISAKAATLHNRMLDFLVFITVMTLRFSHDQQTHTVEFERLLSRSMTGPSGLTGVAARCYRSSCLLGHGDGDGGGGDDGLIGE